MKVTGPLAAVLGNDPQEFFINCVKAYPKQLAQLTRRCSDRTGLSEWTTKPSGGRSYKSSMRADGNDSVQQIALILCLWCIKRPDIVSDEAGRMTMNLPIGPKSLDGSASETTQWPQRWGDEMGEPFTIAALLTIAIPILIAIAPIVLPLLISLVGSGVAAGGELIAKATEAPPPPPDAKIFGIESDYLLIGAAGVAAYLLFIR